MTPFLTALREEYLRDYHEPWERERRERLRRSLQRLERKHQK